MSEIRVNSLGNESNTGGPELSGITEFSGQQYFIPPKGTTAERPSGCPAGSIRFNTDTAHLEYWNGLLWLEFEASSEELGDRNNSNSSGGTGTRGVIVGGYGGSPAAAKDTIDYLSISTLGNTQDFGDISGGTRYRAGCAASRTRGVFAGGFPETADIHFITIASTGDSTDYSNLTDSKAATSGCSNQTRALFGGGFHSPSHTDVIDALTIASSADAIDFGNLSVSRDRVGSISSSVRAVFGNGLNAPNTAFNTIDYVTISTQGDAQDFGDTTQARWSGRAASNSTRGMWGGGYAPTMYNIIDFVTIASTGNAQDFGDLTEAKGGCFSMASSTRALFGGGETPTPQDEIDYVQIATTGNGIDFGDIASSSKTLGGGLSNGHGGL
jgi:hypothetical protein